jgi:hypothetical protein
MNGLRNLSVITVIDCVAIEVDGEIRQKVIKVK